MEMIVTTTTMLSIRMGQKSVDGIDNDCDELIDDDDDSIQSSSQHM